MYCVTSVSLRQLTRLVEILIMLLSTSSKLSFLRNYVAICICSANIETSSINLQKSLNAASLLENFEPQYAVMTEVYTYCLSG